MNETELTEIFESISNWGRWGSEDERGTLNLVTEDVVLRAAAEVREGVTIGCGTVDVSGEAQGLSSGSMDTLTDGESEGLSPGMLTEVIRISYHGPGHTHLDALNHIKFRDAIYNSPGDNVADGFSRNSVAAFADGVMTRAVLLDITTIRGKPWVDPFTPVTADELEAALHRQDVAIQPGDALIIYLGREKRREELGAESEFDRTPVLAGLSPTALPWLREHDVCLLASDGANDARPTGDVGEIIIPVHVGAIVYMGLPLIDNLALERLAAACRKRDRYTFSFTVAPLVIEGASGSPVTPIATF